MKDQEVKVRPKEKWKVEGRRRRKTEAEERRNGR